MMHIHTAAYVLPISSEPIIGGAIVIDGDVIADVGEIETLRRKHPDAPVTDPGQAAILPGFVHCHSHLEITAMRGALDDVEHDFTEWLLKLNSLREKMSPNEIEAAAISGATEGARAGVTCFGDIGRM